MVEAAGIVLVLYPGEMFEANAHLAGSLCFFFFFFAMLAVLLI